MPQSTYTEPPVSFLVLDYQRFESAMSCLQSIRNNVDLPLYKVIYLHNGVEDYPLDLLDAGLIDQLIMPRTNQGLGLGTRDLFAACFSPYAIYWQVDQIMGRRFGETELADLTKTLDGGLCKSISLAGPVCGQNVYSERAHITRTDFYRDMEYRLPLSPGGAGPCHHLEWREGQIQRCYRENGFIHWTQHPQLAIDNGKDAVRSNPDGSIWKHEPDTKRLWLLSGPVKERYAYPKLTDEEWTSVLADQDWPNGKIPENEVKDSFTVAAWH